MGAGTCIPGRYAHARLHCPVQSARRNDTMRHLELAAAARLIIVDERQTEKTRVPVGDLGLGK
jgi:hypothetical protein